ncbi:KpsF/GutQ family sugar-phosphate isomerase [Oleispirillum naphthae]|uniref:KpsF/GutQ family sugar-phosphate isomerase n=1 Tax=Oleispirillum naphthae TaxID=2838853 RepID=UPI0030826559
MPCPAPDPARVASDLTAARHVLEAEAKALAEMSAALGAEFTRALDLLENRLLASEHGRVIVSGMGKSGHIGRKISATLASTGTPSFFVHPAEASHGDLGMITRDDALILLSKSGETPELADIIAYSRRFSIPLIAITEGRGSALGSAADVVLALPVNGEACPLGLAPTTSTTATLAMGDAIAVALLERRGFSASDFKTFHPGGKLGQRLLRVRELMHPLPEAPLIPPETRMADALIVMSAKSFGCVGIVDAAGVLAGIITDGDLRRHMSPDLLEAKAGAVMTASPKTVSPDALAAEALGIMNDLKITSLFAVTPEGNPVGLIHMHDCLRAGVS